jgi:MFS family permease
MAFMAIGGIGSGSFHPQSIAILSTAYRERRAFALGIHDSAANLGEVIAPLTIARSSPTRIGAQHSKSGLCRAWLWAFPTRCFFRRSIAR